jgi:hypothetical protein
LVRELRRGGWWGVAVYTVERVLLGMLGWLVQCTLGYVVESVAVERCEGSDGCVDGKNYTGSAIPGAFCLAHLQLY